MGEDKSGQKKEGKYQEGGREDIKGGRKKGVRERKEERVRVENMGKV